MKKISLTQEQLKLLLLDAQREHHKFENVVSMKTGKSVTHSWADWYADYIFNSYEEGYEEIKEEELVNIDDNILIDSEFDDEYLNGINIKDLA